MKTTPHPPQLRHLYSSSSAKLSGLQHVSTYCAVLMSGLFAGFLLTVMVLEYSLRSKDAATYVQVRLVELDHLDELATVLLVPALLAASVVAMTADRRSARIPRLTITAVLLLLFVLAISVSISVPINAMQHGWAVTAPPAEWASIRDRWQLAHAARTTAAVLAFLALIVVCRRGVAHASGSPWARKEQRTSSAVNDSTLGPGHEVLYVVLSELAAGRPDAIHPHLNDHLNFLARLFDEGTLVTGGPLESPDGASSGNGIYILRAESLSTAERITASDPLHRSGVRIPHVSRWNRKRSWSGIPCERTSSASTSVGSSCRWP